VRPRRRPRQAATEDGSVWTLELPRGFLSFALEKDLRFDPVYIRHIPLIGEVLERFKPDLIHITGPSEIGMLGRAGSLPEAAALPPAGIPMCMSTWRGGRSGFCACCRSANRR